MKYFYFTVKKGEVLLLCGESGSGKTSVIRLINGLIPHYYQGELEGDIHVAGHDIKATELYELAGTVGTVFQNPRSQFFSVDTDGEIVFGPENIGLAPDEIIRRKQEVVDELNIDKLLGRSLFELSGGEKQKIACGSVSALLPDSYISSFPDIPDENAVSLENFFFTYKRRPYIFFRKRLSQDDSEILSLNIPKLKLPKSSVIGIVGNNGTGKSTFLRCVCGLEKDCPGVITMDGRTYKGKERTKLCYMVMQDVNHQLFTDSVMAEVMLSKKDTDEKACEDILESLGLMQFRDKHPMALSGGQKQRVAIASAVAAGAKLLLFDEPTSGLDLSHMEKVGQLLTDLAQSGSTVLVSTHDPELIEQCCNYILYIDKGRAGYCKEIKKKQQHS